MFIYSVIPLMRLPRQYTQLPDYFSSEIFEIGQLVQVPMRSSKIPAIVVRKKIAESQKQHIRKSSYTLRKIEKPLTSSAILSKNFIKLAVTLADYYFVPVGLVLQRMLPPFFSKPTKPTINMLESLLLFERKSKKNPSRTLLISNEREPHYKKLIKNGGTLMLVPQHMQMAFFEKLFDKSNLAKIKSDLTLVEWRNLWKDSYTGKINNILGTRAALFTPFKNLKTILIENENNSSHISWDQHPKFDARYAAEKMAHLYGIDILEADTLPSIEKYQMAKTQNWEIIKEPLKPTKITIVDMREEIKSGNMSTLSTTLRETIKNLKPSEKMFIFITRKGLSSALMCRDCGNIIKCSDCKLPMVLHKIKKTSSDFAAILVCHHCSKKMNPMSKCPQCSSYRIKHLGGGTQRVLQEIKSLAPNLIAQRIDGDMAKTQKEQTEILTKFKNGKINILVGTQIALKEYMLAKPNYSAVATMDTILHLPEYKSSEQVFEAIWRLKAITKQKVIVQTYLPDLNIFKHLQNNDFEPFFREELKKRKIFSWPPYSQLIKLSFSADSLEDVEKETYALKQKLLTQIKYLKRTGLDKSLTDKLEILGPAPAYIEKKYNKYTWYILIKWPKDAKGDIKKLKLRNKLLSMVPIRWAVEVDPKSII